MTTPKRPFYRMSEAAAYLKVSATSVKRFENQGLLTPQRTPGGHRVFTQEELDRFLGQEPSAQATVHYVRSSSGDKAIIASQLEKLEAKYGPATLVVKDRASGLNERRPGLLRLLTLARQRKIDRVVFTSKDRLTRFGYTYLEAYFEAQGVTLEYLQEGKELTAPEELMEDFMALIASFSGRFYRLRTKEHQRLLLREATKRVQDPHG